MASTVRLKLNTLLRGKLPGTIIEVECDTAGNIIDRFWARRLKDAIKDNCIELVKTTRSVKQS